MTRRFYSHNVSVVKTSSLHRLGTEKKADCQTTKFCQQGWNIIQVLHPAQCLTHSDVSSKVKPYRFYSSQFLLFILYLHLTPHSAYGMELRWFLQHFSSSWSNTLTFYRVVFPCEISQIHLAYGRDEPRSVGAAWQSSVPSSEYQQCSGKEEWCCAWLEVSGHGAVLLWALMGQTPARLAGVGIF